MRCMMICFVLFANVAYAVEETNLEFYRPFGDTGEQKLVISTQVNGQCVEQSKRIVREDAWRCSAQGKIYDPCFIKQYGSKKQAICPASPWGNVSVQIDLADAVDDSQQKNLDMSYAYPWGIELKNGEKCQAIDAGRIYDGMPIRYSCDNATVLLGHLQRCKSMWSILQQDAQGQISTVNIEKALF